MSDATYLIRLAEDDDDFILGLVPRFVDFSLPPWRRRHECIEGIRKDLSRHLDEQPANSFLFVAEDDDGEPVGFIHLQKTQDYFTGRSNCHISDIAVAPQHEGRGQGQDPGAAALKVRQHRQGRVSAHRRHACPRRDHERNSPECGG